MTDLFTNPPSTVVLFVTAIVGGGLALRKIYTEWVKDGTITVKEHATQDVVQLLREQIHTFQDSNRELQTEVQTLRKTNNTLVIETDDMRRQLTTIQRENTSLKAEVEALRIQINRLTDLLQSMPSPIR